MLAVTARQIAEQLFLQGRCCGPRKAGWIVAHKNVAAVVLYSSPNLARSNGSQILLKTPFPDRLVSQVSTVMFSMERQSFRQRCS